jgi:hypothetical protein
VVFCFLVDCFSRSFCGVTCRGGGARASERMTVCVKAALKRETRQRETKKKKREGSGRRTADFFFQLVD